MKPLFVQRLNSFLNHIISIYNKSPFRFFAICLFLLFAIFGIYIGIWEGLRFLIVLGGLGTVIVKKIIFILFFILFCMVALSFGVFFYGVTFRSKETQYLLSLPVDSANIILYKFAESLFMTCWIPFFGVILFITAYSQVGGIGVKLSLACIFYSVPFFIISCATGYFLALWILRRLSLKKIVIASVTVVPAIFIALYLKYSSLHQGKDLFYFLSEEVAFLKTSRVWFFPSSWPGYGLTYFEDGNIKKSLLYLVNLWGLSFLLLSLISLPSKTFLFIYHRHRWLIHKKTNTDYLGIVIGYLKVIPIKMRAFIAKDIKLFVREPSQWLQFFLFFGILFFYFLNIRRMSYHLLVPVWKNILTFLNMFSILCIISAIGIRFIYPQWSLEGSNFWILKLAPVSLKKVFIEKFFLSFTTIAFIAGLLIYTSSRMLDIDPAFLKLALFVTLVSTLTMSSYSLGLGAYFADFTQPYYLEAVESLGGFVALIINVGYTFITVFLFGTITHLYFKGKSLYFHNTLNKALLIWVVVSISTAIAVSWIGLWKLEKKEY
ncbi:MAG: hypothetical protein ABH872_01355 [Candidatus Omnitrophota bacterium]